MLQFERLKLLVVVLATWLSILLGFSIITQSQWTALVLIALVAVGVYLNTISRILYVVVTIVIIIFSIIRINLAVDEGSVIIDSIQNPARFEIVSDPKPYTSYQGETYSVDINILTSNGELLAKLSDPRLKTGLISSLWKCTLEVEPSPANKRY